MRCCLVLIREPRRSREPIRTYATHHPDRLEGSRLRDLIPVAH